MYGIILGIVWQSTGFYMALMLAGLKAINVEIWQAARLDGVPFWRLYLEVIIPMMKFTFITCDPPALDRRGEGLRHHRRYDQWRAGRQRPMSPPISPSRPTG